jgi:hypothetical protein
VRESPSVNRGAGGIKGATTYFENMINLKYSYMLVSVNNCVPAKGFAFC